MTRKAAESGPLRSQPDTPPGWSGAGGGVGGLWLPTPRRPSSAARRTLSASFSSRASRAMSLTASNSSRLTRSRSRSQRSVWVFTRVSNSRRTPCATPAASFISRATSSKKRLLVWVMVGPPGALSSMPTKMASAGGPFKAPRRAVFPILRDTSLDFGRPPAASPPYLSATSPDMPALSLPFPNFDPVLVQIGPLAIRWYALAYIVGILGGWVYARAIIRAEQLWGGRAPLTVIDFDDFILWVTLGIILGG